MKPSAALLSAMLLLGSASAQDLGLPPTEAGQVADAAPTNAPEVVRRSSVTLPFEAPVEARELVIAHRLPSRRGLSGGQRRAGRPAAG